MDATDDELYHDRQIGILASQDQAAAVLDGSAGSVSDFVNAIRRSRVTGGELAAISRAWLPSCKSIRW